MKSSLIDVLLEKCDCTISGVIADSVITHHAVLEERDEFLIIASDGIWEFIDSSEAVMLVGNSFDKGCTASEASIQLIHCAMKTFFGLSKAFCILRFDPTHLEPYHHWEGHHGPLIWQQW